MKRKNDFRVLAAALCLAMAAAGSMKCHGETPEEKIRCYGAEPFLKEGGTVTCAAGEDTNIHILLIGQDRRQGTGGRRSDSIILCTFCPNRDTLVLTSILRDLYVQIPGHGKNRINAAYAFGGPELLDRTIERNLGISIAGNIEVDFDQFPRVIDLLGGVTVELREDEAAEINLLVPEERAIPGKQTLSGAQTLVYSRIRRLDADSDFSRTQRQRKVLQSLLSSYQNISLTGALKLLKELLPMVDTDLGYFQVMTYSRMILPVLRNLRVVSQRIPAPGDASDGTVDGMSVLIPDLPAIRSMLEKSLCETG